MENITDAVVKQLTDFKGMRKKCGLSLRQVEKETGIHNSIISQMESRHIKEPSFSKVIQLFNFYNNIINGKVNARKGR